jgi:DNA-binding response OmpR family regulator
MTAFSVHEDRAHTLSAEFQACLLKPFTPEELLETILAILSQTETICLLHSSALAASKSALSPP